MASPLVVITTFGSLGDLHPYLAIGQALTKRGVRVRVATIRLFQERVEAAGLEYFPLRATAVTEPSEEMIRGALHPRTGVQYILQTLVMPAIRTAYEDTEAAAEGADLLVSHPLTFATRLVAERHGLPWLSTQLAPIGLFSAYDPPMLPGLGALLRLHAPPAVFRAIFRLADWRVRFWLRPLSDLRKQLGVPDYGNALLAGGHSPYGVLALFSRLLSRPQPDWPASVEIAGFPFYDQDVEPDPELETWLAAGAPPVIFTLGSSALLTPGRFFAESLRAAERLGQRALLIGYSPADAVNLANEDIARPRGGVLAGHPGAYAIPYGSYARLFPRGAAIVHQGGIGTTAEALRAGRPMLIMPFGVDQPDNAARVARLGIGRMFTRRQYRSRLVEAALRAMLQPSVAHRAAEIGTTVRAEDGAARAADVIGALLATRR